MIEPIRPEEVTSVKPDQVIEAFNELIRKYWDGTQATFKQAEVVMLISSKLKLKSNKPIFDNHWLDVEALYEEYGWRVEYDKPGYNETYQATYTFKG